MSINNDQISNNQITYSYIRRSIDTATLQWEMARLLLSQQYILQSVGISKEIYEKFMSDYKRSIDTAINFAYNAAFGNVLTEYEKELGKIEFNKMVDTKNSTVEEISKKYYEYQLKGTERGNILYKEINRIESKLNWQNFLKHLLNIFGLMGNILGLFIIIKKSV